VLSTCNGYRFITTCFCFTIILLQVGCSSNEIKDIPNKNVNENLNRTSAQFLSDAVTCKGLKDSLPQDLSSDFSVSETIYLYLTWKNLIGKHQINIYWYTPAGKIQDQTTYSFSSNGDTYNTWHHLQLFDNQVRLDNFVGQWTAKIVLNNDLVGEQHFSVSYP